MMACIRSLPVVFLCATLGLAADSVTLHTLSSDGKSDKEELKGELVRITDKEVVVRDAKANKEIVTPLARVLDVVLPHAGAPAANYIDVELIDGTLLHCGQVVLKNRDVELKLVSGQEIKLPLAQIAYVLNDAQDAKVRDKWKKALSKQGNHDLVAVKNEGSFQTLEGTLQDADAKGQNISFVYEGNPVPLRLDRVFGMSFFRKPDPSRPETICKVFDTSNNLVIVRKIKQTAAGYTVTTVCGAEIAFPTQLLARLDFSKGKIAYLSDADKPDCDIKLLKKVETSTLDGTDHVRLDRNLDGGPLKIGSQPYPKGLAIPATTELVYDIGGEFKEFRTILGFDDQVTGDSHVQILIEGDNRELYKTELRRSEKDKKGTPITLDVKNVKILRIVVSSTDLLDLGYHINFADAKVSK